MIEPSPSNPKAAIDAQLERYTWEKATLIIHLQLLPGENDDQKVAISVGIRGEPPLVQTVELSQLNLPAPIQQMLERLKAELPERQKQKAVELERQRVDALRQNYKRRQVSPPSPSSEPSSSSSHRPQQLSLLP
ncbi:hypothetical protein [Lusitaniella coriacea]|uniref:hypothetical protein n=1 Tax=Lusitaniella coriacea TaxID=1983105 RepID=UPI003CFB3A0B